MTAAAEAFPDLPRPRPGLAARFFASRPVAVAAVVAGLVLIWYAAVLPMNWQVQRDADQRAGIRPPLLEFALSTYSMQRPVLPAPHQVARELYQSVFEVAPSSPRSLVFHGWVTLSATLLGFAIGALLGIVLAILIIHVPSLDKSLMPWIIASQTIPILAIAPMVVVVLAAIGLTGLLPKALISAYLSFFPVTVGMVKGLRLLDPIRLDLMRTYHADAGQTFRKLRWPSALPFLFVSLRVAVAASLVGAIVAELPTGAVAGLGARLLAGSYYGQTVQIWAALFAAAFIAAVLVGVIGLIERMVLRRMGLAR